MLRVRTCEVGRGQGWGKGHERGGKEGGGERMRGEEEEGEEKGKMRG